MYFKEENNRRVNIGEKLSNRNDFMDKIKSNKENSFKMVNKSSSYKVIENKITFFKSRIVLPEYALSKLNNLKQILNYIKSCPKDKVEKIVITGLSKLNKDIFTILSAYNISEFNEEIITCILELLSSLNSNSLTTFINENYQTFGYFIFNQITLIMKFLDKKGYLIDKSNKSFLILVNILRLFDKDDVLLNDILCYLNTRKCFSFILLKIVNKIEKIVEPSYSKQIIEISTKICKFKCNSNNKHKKLLCNIVSNIVLSKAIKGHIFNDDFLLNLFIAMVRTSNLNFEMFSSQLLIKIMRTFYFNEILIKEKTIESLTSIFNELSIKDIKFETSFKKQDFIILTITTLKNTCRLYEKNKSITKFIDLINSSLKMFLSVYSYNNENIPPVSILDYIFNQSYGDIKNDLLNDVMMFTLNNFILNSRKENVNNYNNNTSNSKKIDVNKFQKYFSSEELEQLEIISFCLDQKLQYKANNLDSLLFNKNCKITDNIPYNKIFLIEISKLILKAYVSMLSNKVFNDITILQNSLIVNSIRSLYELDYEVDFNVDKEEFWCVYELIIKISTFDKERQLEIIKLTPFIFPIKLRLDFFLNMYKKHKKNREQLLMLGMGEDIQKIDLTINRDNMFDHTLALYLSGMLNPNIPWKIIFVNKLGMVEDGQDAGGLFPEFLIKLSEEAFSKEIGYFVESTTGFLIPNNNSEQISEYHLTIFEFLGFIVGISIINEIKIWPKFASFFLNNILGYNNGFNEVKNFDQDLYKNLILLMEYKGDIENDFGVSFIVNEQINNKTVEIDLIPNGKNINVTNQNKFLYIRRIAQYKLTTQIEKQCQAFKKGLDSVLEKDSYKLFTSNEFRQIISGFDKEFDLMDWKLNTVYTHIDTSVKENEDLINDFWEIVYELDIKECEKLLFFVTSMKRPPLKVSY